MSDIQLTESQLNHIVGRVIEHLRAHKYREAEDEDCVYSWTSLRKEVDEELITRLQNENQQLSMKLSELEDEIEHVRAEAAWQKHDYGMVLRVASQKLGACADCGYKRFPVGEVQNHNLSCAIKWIDNPPPPPRWRSPNDAR